MRVHIKRPSRAREHRTVWRLRARAVRCTAAIRVELARVRCSSVPRERPLSTNSSSHRSHGALHTRLRQCRTWRGARRCATASPSGLGLRCDQHLRAPVRNALAAPLNLDPRLRWWVHSVSQQGRHNAPNVAAVDTLFSLIAGPAGRGGAGKGGVTGNNIRGNGDSAEFGQHITALVTACA